MAFFKRAKKPNEATISSPPLASPVSSTPMAGINATTDGDAEAEANKMALARTRTEDIVYPSGIKLAVLLLSTFVSMFLVALDRLIISTAIPQITDDFHSQTDIGWYGSAYMLTNCAFQLSFGKLYTFYSVKYVFLTAIALFEIGSAICGAAPSSVAFIVGRAIAGVGSAGIMSGAITVIVYAVPLHRRPLYQGLFGAVFGLASVIGPLLGGAFTSKVTWRWCFYINLPFGGIAMVFIFFLLTIPDRSTTHLPNKEKLAQLDSMGIAFLLPGVICLLLALQWGGSKYAWHSGRIIALLVLAGVLLIGFVLVQIYKPDTATVPPRIIKQRSMLAGAWATLALGASMMIVVYYLPIWFQAIEGVSAVESGIRLLPMVLPMVFASMLSGILTARIGYYTPFMLFGSILLCIGAGLLTTLEVNTSEGKWFGFQVIYGFGMGCTFQGPNLAAQTVLATVDVPVGTSLMFFTQLLGGAIFTSVASNVLDNELIKHLSAIPGIDASAVLNEGATELLSGIPDSLHEAVLEAYNLSLRTVLQVALVMTCLIVLGTASMEWRSVKSKQKKVGESAAEEGKATGHDEAEDEKHDARSVESVKNDTSTESDPEKEKTNKGDDDVPADKVTVKEG